MKNNVIAIFSSNYTEGNGFFLKNYFFTSGHVIAQAENPYIVIDNQQIELTNPVFFEANNTDSKSYDIAIFDLNIKGANDWEFFEKEPTQDMILKSISVKAMIDEYVECDFIPNGVIVDNYFAGLSSVNLKEGSSGSPVVLDNKVVGIMTAGNNGGLDSPCNPELPLTYCLFLSSKAIIKLLKGILFTKDDINCNIAR